MFIRNLDSLAFLIRIFIVLDHYCERIFNGYYQLLINFDSFGGFWRNLEIQDGGPGWPPLKNDYVTPTSYDVINPFCGPQRKRF